MKTKGTVKRNQHKRIVLAYKIVASIIAFFMFNIMVQAVSVPLAMLSYERFDHPPQSLIFYWDMIVIGVGCLLYKLNTHKPKRGRIRVGRITYYGI
jgi:xanthine/uracil permease